MKRFLLVVSMVFLFECMWAQQVFKVSTVKDFIKVIGSNRSIELQPGTYNLAKAYQVSNPNINWEKKGNGYELIVQNVKNLTIKGNGAVITANSPYCEVIKIKKSDTVLLDELTFKHEVTEVCMAGVLFLDTVQNITINNCSFMGSGSIGITVQNSENVFMESGSITNCTNGFVRLHNSSYCNFYMVSFFDNIDTGTALYAKDVVSLTFDSCSFYDNSGIDFIDVTGEDISFIVCDFTGNNFGNFVSSDTIPFFAECYGEGNTFDEELYSVSVYNDYNPYAYYELTSAGLSLYYPVWYEEENRNDGILHLFDASGGIDLYMLETYTLQKGENADTQFEALSKKALKKIPSASGKLKITKITPIVELELNTEAHPYYYLLTADIVINGIKKKAVIKIVYNDNKKLWAFILLCDNLEGLEESPDIITLSSIDFIMGE